MQVIYDLKRRMERYQDSLRQFDSANTDIITTWNGEQADKNLEKVIAEFTGQKTKACRIFIERYLVGKKIQSVAGICEFNDKSVGKLVDKMRTTKQMAIPRIPEILIHGEIIKNTDEDGHRSDSLDDFVTIQKILTIKKPFKTYRILATIKIATNINEMQIPYYFGAKMLDSLEIKTGGQFPRPRVFADRSATAGRYKSTYGDIKPQKSPTSNHNAKQHFIILVDTLTVKEL